MTKARDLANSAAAFSAVSATELGYVDGVTSAIQTQLDAKVAKTLTSTTGDIIYASAANTPARLGIGSSAQVLTVASGVPSWATPAGGGGKVLQVVQGISSGYIAITSTNTYTDANLSLAITPTLNTSKVLIFINQHINMYTNTAAQANGGFMKILRGSTDIWTGSATQPTVEQMGVASGGPSSIASMVYLDSPATTSATTYKTQWKQTTNSYDHTLYMNQGTFQSTITLMEIGA